MIYASSEKNRMLACRFGEHRDNSRNSQSVFLVVYSKIKDEIILKKINRDCCGCNSPFFALQEIAFLYSKKRSARMHTAGRHLEKSRYKNLIRY